MDQLEKVMKIFAEEGTREEFLIRLKEAGENSQELQSLIQINQSLGMHRTSRHVTQTTILQHAFQFSEPFECFTQFRSVCKAWKFAIESKPRFNHVDRNTALYFFYSQYFRRTNYNAKEPISVVKAIKSLKNIEIPGQNMHDLFNCMRLFAYNAQNLKSISFTYAGQMDSAYPSLLCRLLKNSSNTLCMLKLPNFIFPPVNGELPNLKFPNLRIIDVTLIYARPDFANFFPMFLRSAPKIELIKFGLTGVLDTQILEHLGTSYGNHCILWEDALSYRTPIVVDHIPVKIVKTNYTFIYLANRRYSNSIEYLQIPAQNYSGLSKYRTILQSFSSLKGICIKRGSSNQVLFENDFYENKDFIEEEFDDSEIHTWRDCLTYMQSIGIKILDMETFDSMDEKISKTLPWKLHFYYHQN